MEKFGYFLGYGVGFEIYEFLRFLLKFEMVLEENMVVIIELGIYIEDFGGVRIEDIVVVKSGGCEILIKLLKELIVI